jgi:hypothetical protein
MKKSIWILVTLLAFNCATDDFKPSDEPKCMVGRYVYNQDNGADLGYEITYVENSLTLVDLINDQVQVGANWATSMTYKHIYRNDSLYIKDFRQFREGATYLTAQLNTNIQSVITSFPDNNGMYRFSFDYSKDDQITVTLDKMNGNVATFDSRGVYYLDDLGNVTKLVITRNPDIHANDPDPFTTREITYTYDIVLNPLKDLVLPHFLKAELPDITYFSMNNRLTEKYDGNTYTYKFEYGTDPMPTRQTKPDGVVEKYEYPNCTN